jgi:hypothetical protein
MNGFSQRRLRMLGDLFAQTERHCAGLKPNTDNSAMLSGGVAGGDINVSYPQPSPAPRLPLPAPRILYFGALLKTAILSPVPALVLKAVGRSPRSPDRQILSSSLLSS